MPKRILYAMPRSTSDILQSTAVCKRIKENFPDSILYFATLPQYKSLLEGCPWIDHLLRYTHDMDNVRQTEQYFDIYYSPHLFLQYQNTNFVHDGNDHTQNIIKHFLWHSDCRLDHFEKDEFYINTDDNIDVVLPDKYIVIVTNDGHTQESKRWGFWQELVNNLVPYLKDDIKIVQLGMENDKQLKDPVYDLRGKLSLSQLNYVIQKSELVLSVDSYPLHAAYIMNVDCLGLFASSYSRCSGTNYKAHNRDNSKSINIEPTNDKPALYLSQNNEKQRQLDEIDPEEVFIKITSTSTFQRLFNDNVRTYTSIYPTISGYTTIYNGESVGLPYIESIKSMIGFCDQVIVVDGESNDGTWERLNKEFENNSIVTLFQKQWDQSEPGIDGQQKAFARALCTGDFCWQQDADEVVNEEDYQKIRKLVRAFPQGIDIIALPVIDYFDGDYISTDYHCWKWRLSRNLPDITHGIPRYLQFEKDGKVYAKRGTDGCNYITVVEENDCPFIMYNNFWNQRVDTLRYTDTELYEETMNKIFNSIPSVHHYSWFSLRRKLNHQLKFWNKQWNLLYGDTEEDSRFFSEAKNGEVTEEIIEKEITKLREAGGCHEGGVKVSVTKQHPAIMEEWKILNNT